MSRARIFAVTGTPVTSALFGDRKRQCMVCLNEAVDPTWVYMTEERTST